MPSVDDPIDPSQLPGVTDDEVAQLADVIRVVTKDCEPPTINFAIPEEGVTQLFHYVCGFLRKFDVPRWIATFIAGTSCVPLLIVNALLSMAITVLAPFMGALVQQVLGLLDVLRKQLDPSVANVAVTILNELLGTEFSDVHLASGTDVGSHLARAREVGGLLHDQLTREFQGEADVTPAAGAAAARTMSGFLINFGTATGIIGALGGLVPFIHLDEMREIGEEVARNLGLGRLHRQVMRPLINTLIATPYQWYLNQKFHPTQFREADLVNAFQQTVMPHDVIFKAMDLLGYSQDKIEELIRLHAKKLTMSDIELFFRWQIFTADQASAEARKLGYLDETATAAMFAEQLKRTDADVRLLVDAAETAAVEGHITVDDFSTLLGSLPLAPREKDFRLQAMQFKVKAPRTHLTLAQAQSAFEQGLWDVTQLEDYLVARGYGADDVNTIELLTLLKLAKLEEAIKVAQFAYDKKVAAAKAKNLPIPPPPAILVGS